MASNVHIIFMTTLNTFKLLLPALIPSWRFFEVVTASPRIEIANLQSEYAKPDMWKEVRPKPERVSFCTMFRRLFWNPHGNETLFLVSCAERLIANPTEHTSQEILKRVVADLKRDPENPILPPYLQFRLVFISRGSQKLERHIRYTSPVYQIYVAHNNEL